MAKTEKQDRRTKKTQRNLREALISLILEKGYDRVTVQDIIDRADVGRSTFYAHFESKDNLLLSGFEDVRRMLLEMELDVNFDNKITGDFYFNSLRLFQHADEHRSIYRALAGKAGGDLFLRKMFRQMHDLFLQKLRESIPDEQKDSLETKIAAHFYVSSLIATLTFWLDNNIQLSSNEIDELFRNLTLPGIDRLMQLKSEADKRT